MSCKEINLSSINYLLIHEIPRKDINTFSFHKYLFSMEIRVGFMSVDHLGLEMCIFFVGNT